MIDALDGYLLPWLSTNLLALILLFVCWKKPGAGRLSFAFIFLLAAITNFIIGIQNPEGYLIYEEWVLLTVYETFMQEYFTEYARLVVVSIAISQFLIALGLFFAKLFYRPSLIGGILFFLAISPLGLGSAFPSPIIFALSLSILLVGKRLDKPKSVIT